MTGGRIPVCVITNASLLYRREVRRELRGADLIIPSLDTVTPSLYRKLNRPLRSFSVGKLIDGLIALRREYSGRIWLEIMLVAGVNDSREEAQKLKKTVDKIAPDRIQLNIPVRPAAESVGIPEPRRLEQIKKILNRTIDVVAAPSKPKLLRAVTDLEETVTESLRRRPATLRELAHALGQSPRTVRRCIDTLLLQGRISGRCRGETYYLAND